MLKPASRPNHVEDARVHQQAVVEDVRVPGPQIVEQQTSSASASDSEDDNVAVRQNGPRVTSLFEALDEVDDDDDEDIVMITDDGITTTADMDDVPPFQQPRII